MELLTPFTDVYFNPADNGVYNADGSALDLPSRVQGNGRTVPFTSDITEVVHNGWRLAVKWGVSVTWHKGTDHRFTRPYNGDLTDEDVTEMWREIYRRHLSGQSRYGY